MHLKKLAYVLSYVSDQYKTQQMCYKVILENNRTLKYVTDCFMTQEMCNKADDTSTIKFVPECYRNQNMFVSVVYIWRYIFDPGNIF